MAQELIRLWICEDCDKVHRTNSDAVDHFNDNKEHKVRLYEVINVLDWSKTVDLEG